MTLSAPALSHGLEGNSPQIATVRRLIAKAARNRLPVLLLGESGTGKEIVARAIHQANPRGLFIPIDCGSLVGALMESELFGHVKGAFSGAVENKKGLVELADGGTAFFDEIGDLALELQVKLLRLIQEREFRPVGALKWHRVDIRVIAATHRDLKAEVAAGRFRQDLYYRLNVFLIRLPPLRERKQDIPVLANYFFSGTERGPESGGEFRPSQEIMDAMLSYDWPGNVRELKNCIERMVATSSEGPLQLTDLPSPLQYHRSSLALESLSSATDSGQMPEWQAPPKSPVISLPESEKQAISKALAATKGERAKAARLLGIGRTTLYRKIREYGLK
jgi:DNA-binding NtrC family response regulator